MDLLGVVNKVIQNNLEAQKLTDLTIGTVTSTDPLEIQINPQMPPLPEQVLLLTDCVKELTDNVVITAEFKTALEDLGATISDDVIGKVLGVQTLQVGDKVQATSSFKSVLTSLGITLTDDIIGTVQRQHNLHVGDKVVLLRVMRGQEFIVLSKA